MNSSAQPSRRIASNLLWTPQEIVRTPVVTFYDGDDAFVVETSPHPDRLPETEFYAGLLVADFPTDFRAAFERLRASSGDLLSDLPHTVVPGGIWVVLSGLDYARMRLTAESRIQRL